MDFKVSDLLKAMLGAAKGEFGETWPEVQDFAKTEFKKLAQTLVDIGKMRAQGKITATQARILIRMQRRTTQTVLLTIEGLGILAVERAINAAIAVVRDTVNKAAGLVLV